MDTGRPFSFRFDLMSLLLAVLLPALGRPQTSPGTEPLKFLISVEQQSITAPFPARLTLHLHNSGQVPVWLYRHAQDPDTLRQTVAMPMSEEEEQKANRTTGGSTLVVRLEPATEPLAQPAGAAQTVVAGAKVLTNVGLPHPILVKLRPGEDYEEKAIIRISPAQVRADSGDRPLWGPYRLTGIYGAKYSNGDEVSPDLGVTIWQGEVASNTIELELKPPPASSQGSVTGMVRGSENQPAGGALVSLSDRQERLVDQALTDLEGRFAFDHLPLGLYWITVRRPEVNVETTTFRHVELTSGTPTGTMDLLLLPPETYEPKQVLHKPVLLRVVDSAGHPAVGVTVESTWSSGTVLDNVKGETTDDGTLTLNLIPGRNYLSLRQRGCPKEEQRVDVRRGSGIDDFKLVVQCK
jgi:Carboxypeptidase regulatory-like domain